MESEELEKHPGYFKVPGYSLYGVSKTGDVLNVKTLEKLSGSTNPDGYYNFRLVSDSGKTLTWGRHRLLGFVFKNPGTVIDSLIVNHENGIKGDDVLENLEWMTYQGNQEHAGRNGLTEKCLPISVRDVDTGEVVEYPSMIACARETGFTKDAISHRIKTGQGRIFPERKQYRLASEVGLWKVFANVENEMLLNGNSKSVLVKHLLLDIELEFPKMSLAAEHLNVPLSTLSVWLNQPNQPVLPGYVQLKMRYDSKPWREVSDPYTELEQYTGKRAVVVFNSKTAHRQIYDSANECARVHGLSPTALNYRLQSKGNTQYRDGYTYCYYSDSL